MNDSKTGKAAWKHKVISEMLQYWMSVLYLAIFFSVFSLYRELILANYQIVYEDYWIGLLKAVVLAKLIMIGDALRVGRGFEDKPLIYPTLFRTVAFSLWVVLFNVIELAVYGFMHGKGLAGALNHLLAGHFYEFLGRCLVVFFSFIPLFALKELGRVLGRGRIQRLFFQRRSPADSVLPECQKG